MELSAPFIESSLGTMNSGSSGLRSLITLIRNTLAPFFSELDSPKPASLSSAQRQDHWGVTVLEQPWAPRAGHVYTISGASDSLARLHEYWPLLAQLTWQRKWVVCVAPPVAIPASIPVQAEVNGARFMEINAKSTEGRSWALLQSLQGRHCGAVLYWGALTESVHCQIKSIVQETGVYFLWFKNE